jgi:hypothetical protein
MGLFLSFFLDSKVRNWEFGSADLSPTEMENATQKDKKEKIGWDSKILRP